MKATSARSTCIFATCALKSNLTRGIRSISTPSMAWAIASRRKKRPVPNAFPSMVLDKVSPGSDQLYSWGGAGGPKAPPPLPQGGGLGRGSRPQPPTQKCKVRKNLVLGHWSQVKVFAQLSSSDLRFSCDCVD